MKKSLRHNTHLVLFVVIIFVSIGCSNNGTASASYEFTNVRRGTIERTVSASGTIKPVSTVNVLPRMSGRVESIHVDFNHPVSRGDILAELNTDVLKLRREQQLAAVIKARANYELQSINYRNQQELARRNLISEYELMTGKAQLDGLAADLAVAESNLLVVETEINQYAFITSPIDGIVLDRRINIGDTVVDSSSSSSAAIFTLAENLREMQIEANVGELDIASISTGQIVRFTLESLPGRSFNGIVESVRFVPVVTNNVVSYTVIVKVDNPDGALLPGMTCAVDFIVERSENVLVVQNAALRYQPSVLSEEKIEDMIFQAALEGMNEEQRGAAIAARTQARAAQPAGSPQQGTGLAGMLSGPQRMMAVASTAGRQVAASRQISQAVVMRNVWFVNGDGNLEVTRVRTGITNGTFTEIISPLDMEGRQLILRERI